MFSTLNDFVTLFGNKPTIITFEIFQEYSNQAKQNCLYEALKQAKFKPKLNVYHPEDFGSTSPSRIELELYNGITLLCGVKGFNHAFFVSFGGKKYILDIYKKKFDEYKLECLKNKDIILETQFVEYTYLPKTLEISYYLLPQIDMNNILIDTLNIIK